MISQTVSLSPCLRRIRWAFVHVGSFPITPFQYCYTISTASTERRLASAIKSERPNEVKFLCSNVTYRLSRMPVLVVRYVDDLYPLISYTLHAISSIVMYCIDAGLSI